MKELNLCEILKGHEGETFYSPIYGKVKIAIVDDNTIEIWPLRKDAYLPLSSNGHHKDNPKEGELLLFPSKDQRDWNKWDKENNPPYDACKYTDCEQCSFKTSCLYLIKEQKHKVPKTWSELWNNKKAIGLAAGVGVSEFSYDHIDGKTLANTPIEKSALALLKIHQLIEAGYGGNVTNEESYNKDLKYHIGYYFGDAPHNKKPMFVIYNGITNHNPLRFHTKEQAKEFLEYPENVQLLKDYFMI